MAELIGVDNEPAAIDTAELLGLIDRLEVLLHASGLSEIEVEADGTSVVLRAPSAIAQPAIPSLPVAANAADSVGAQTPPSGVEADEKVRPLEVLAPLTGLYYKSPSPGAEPYIREGTEVHVGQVIGLIEAMKLFNEIKSDVAGRVVRICVDDGGLVKAKQPLLELSPL